MWLRGPSTWPGPSRRWAGAGWLVQAGGRLYGTGSAVIREFDPATGTTLRLGPGIGVFPSADGRHAYIERTSTSLVELRASGRGVLRRLRTPAGWYLAPNAAGEVTAGVGGGGILVSSRPDGPSRSPVEPRHLGPGDGEGDARGQGRRCRRRLHPARRPLQPHCLGTGPVHVWKLPDRDHQHRYPRHRDGPQPAAHMVSPGRAPRSRPTGRAWRSSSGPRASTRPAAPTTPFWRS